MRALLPGLATLLLTACASTHYEWGRYEDSVRVVTTTPDGFDLEAEIDALEQQLERTVSEDRPVPPGLHAHVGWLQAEAGNTAAARAHLEAEKALFPESARFVDGLLARLVEA